MSTPTTYPLSWPLGHPRTRTREVARFSATNQRTMARRSLTLNEAVERIQAQLDFYGRRLSGLLLSTNVPTRQDGLPRSGLAEPADPGAAVYFQLDGRPYCLPCDKYTRVADNLAAIAATLESTRTIERHGVVNTHNVYADFKALPQQAGPATGAVWWQQLELPGPSVTLDDIEAAYKRLARQRHPDAGGSHELMAELNQARAAGKATVA